MGRAEKPGKQELLAEEVLPVFRFECAQYRFLACAPADVSLEPCQELLARGARISSEQGFCRHDQPGRAIAALHRAAFDELLLNYVRLVASRDPFDRQDLPILHLGRQHKTGIHRAAVHQYIAAATLSFQARSLCPRELELQPHEIEQSLYGLHPSLHLPPIEGESQLPKLFRVLEPLRSSRVSR